MISRKGLLPYKSILITITSIGEYRGKNISFLDFYPTSVSFFLFAHFSENGISLVHRVGGVCFIRYVDVTRSPPACCFVTFGGLC